uniref:Uncharacterized protein n=1 Tax=Rhizophora mucronata TaxID=61149 RepID=A0A2P2KKP5_RHIMU
MDNRNKHAIHFPILVFSMQKCVLITENLMIQGSILYTLNLPSWLSDDFHNHSTLKFLLTVSYEALTTSPSSLCDTAKSQEFFPKS